MNENYVTLTIGKQKNIALIAHDNKKAELIAWCETNKIISFVEQGPRHV